MKHNHKNDTWDLRRVPTKAEQIFVILLTSLISIVCGVVFANILSEYFKPYPTFKNPWPFLVLVGTIFVLCILRTYP